jgi:hypothetical protein
VSEAELLHAMLEWLVNEREPMPLPTQHLVQSFGLDTLSGVSSPDPHQNGRKKLFRSRS